MTALARGSNPLLTTLRLQSNELDARAIEVLASAITLHLPLLTELELNGNYGEAEDECYVAIGKALEKWGHEDALDELDELEERGSEDEKEEDEEEQEEEEEDAKEEIVVEGEVETGGEDVRANEAAVVVEAKVAENEEEPKLLEDTKESDALADLLNKVHIE